MNSHSRSGGSDSMSNTSSRPRGSSVRGDGVPRAAPARRRRRRPGPRSRTALRGPAARARACPRHRRGAPRSQPGRHPSTIGTRARSAGARRRHPQTDLPRHGRRGRPRVAAPHRRDRAWLSNRSRTHLRALPGVAHSPRHYPPAPTGAATLDRTVLATPEKRRTTLEPGHPYAAPAREDAASAM